VDACTDNPKLVDVADLGQGLIYHGEELQSGGTTYSDQQFVRSQPGFVLFNRGLQLHQLPNRYWMNLDPEVIRRAVSGTTVGTPQVLLNYAPASRGPWRLKALIDNHGHPITSNFMSVRPTNFSYSTQILWALLKSPFANAYAFSHLGKRHNIVGVLRNFPIPKISAFEGAERAANAYLVGCETEADPEKLRMLLLNVDSEVLKLYSLPLELEQRLLGLFSNWERVGVPFKQTAYLPKALEGKLHFSDFLQFEKDWSVTNRERGELIGENISGKLTVEERTRLDCLQTYADYHFQRLSHATCTSSMSLRGGS